VTGQVRRRNLSLGLAFWFSRILRECEDRPMIDGQGPISIELGALAVMGASSAGMIMGCCNVGVQWD
jgi:hypothetical protein